MSNQLQRKLLELAGDSASITKASSKDWSSISFEGQKHALTFLFTNMQHGHAFIESVTAEGENLVTLTDRTMLCDLSVTEFDSIVPVNHLTVTVEALTLKD